MLAIKPNNVDIPIGGRRHFLGFAQGKNGAVQVAIFGRQLVFSLFGIGPHSGLERAAELFVLSVEKDLYILSGLTVLILGAKAFDTWAEATFQVILETWAWELAVD